MGLLTNRLLVDGSRTQKDRTYQTARASVVTAQLGRFLGYKMSSREEPFAGSLTSQLGRAPLIAFGFLHSGFQVTPSARLNSSIR